MKKKSSIKSGHNEKEDLCFGNAIKEGRTGEYVKVSEVLEKINLKLKCSDEWDKEIERDIQSEKFQNFADKAISELQNSKSKII